MIDELKNELMNSDSNKTLTENGAVAYKSTGRNLVDLNFKVSSFRRESASRIVEEMEKAYYEDPIMFCKWLFFLRDCREGLGERRTFEIMFNNLTKVNLDYALKLIRLIPEYGYWKDVLPLLGHSNARVRNEVYNVIVKQLKDDIFVVCNQHLPECTNKPISLLGKWLPSINAGGKSRAIAKQFCKVANLDYATYRKTLAQLRKYLEIVECKMCAQDFGSINYCNVPSVAGLLYRNAFMKHDGERYKAYIDSVNKGEAKINASVLFPHDVYRQYASNSYPFHVKSKVDSAIEAYWNALPNNVTDDTSTLVVCDGSGSMTCCIGSSHTMAIDVSRSLAIYFSQYLKGEFKDKFIEFSSKPTLIDLSKCDSLWAKRKVCELYYDCSNTNIEKVFDVVLKTAIKNNMSQEDLPKNILIISDMEFDYAISNKVDEALFDDIRSRFEESGYTMPKLIFWNVNGRTNAIPMRENPMGVILVSGFSTNVCKMVCSGETDPYKALLGVINSERYTPIEQALVG